MFTLASEEGVLFNSTLFSDKAGVMKFSLVFGDSDSVSFIPVSEDVNEVDFPSVSEEAANFTSVVIFTLVSGEEGVLISTLLSEVEL